MGNTGIKKSIVQKRSTTIGIQQSKSSVLNNWLLISIIAIAVFVIYKSCLSAALTNWDEGIYVQKNPYIKDLSISNIKRLFSEPVFGVYAPLSFLSFSIDYYFAGLDGSHYHTINVVLHLLNCTWLFWIILKISSNNTVAFITTFLFAIHPMQVEAVAWVASRKDVLYTFFYFASWWTYIKHLQAKSGKRFLIASFLLFVCSLLSKNQAVTLPVILLLTQLLMEKKWKAVRMAELSLFFLLSLIMGLYTLSYAKGEALDYRTPFTFIEKIYYSIIAFGDYIIKFISPTQLSSIYNFTESSASLFYIRLFTGLILTIALIWAVIKFKNRIPWLSFGLLFFAVNIFLLLHVFATNSSLIYERFSYVAYIGFAFIIATAISRLKGRIRIASLVALTIFSSWLIYLSYERTKIWNNGMSLWSDIIKKNPEAEQAYNNRGRILIAEKKYDEALVDINKALELEPNLSQAYNNLGIIYNSKNKKAEAIKAFDKSLELSPQMTSTRINRAIYYTEAGEYDKAISDLKQCLKQEPGNEESYRLLGIAYAKTDNMDLAEFNLRKSYEIDPRQNGLNILANEFFVKGTNLLAAKNYDEAIKYLTKSINLYPDNADALYNLGGAYFDLGRKEEAITLWKKVLIINPNHPQAKITMEKINKK